MYKANVMDNCYEGNNRGQLRRRTFVATTATNMDGRYSRDCPLPKRMRKEKISQVFTETVKRIFWEVMEENNWKLEDFSAEEAKDKQSLSSSINVVHSENVKPRKDYLILQIQTLQCKVNNRSTKKWTTSLHTSK